MGSCPSCGAPAAPGAAYCTWCGASTAPARRPLGRPFTMAAVVLLLAGGGLAYSVFGRSEAAGDVVVYEEPLDPAAAPFTSPADVSAASSTVCDRERLVRFLQERPGRLREWARVPGVEPAGVAFWIRSLRPATLARDARFTNHSYLAGRAVPRQSILPAKTAVLVDPDGKAVVRCRSGSPLLPPKPVAHGVCRGCPRGYRLPGLEEPVFVSFAGTYALTALGVQGDGCELASAGGSMVVQQDENRITVTATDLSGVGEVAPDGSVELAVSGGGGREGVISGRFTRIGFEDGRLTAFGCTVLFTGTRA